MLKEKIEKAEKNHDNDILYMLNKLYTLVEKNYKTSLKMRILRRDWELLNRTSWNILNLELEDNVNHQKLESSVGTFNILGKLNTPMFVHI